MINASPSHARAYREYHAQAVRTLIFYYEEIRTARKNLAKVRKAMNIILETEVMRQRLAYWKPILDDLAKRLPGQEISPNVADLNRARETFHKLNKVPVFWS